jgi:hypothetical protein
MTTGYTGQTRATKDALVYTSDGHEIGKVKTIVGECFQVDAPMQFDYWLGSDLITSDEGGVLRLSISKDKLGDFKEDAPDHSGLHKH